MENSEEDTEVETILDDKYFCKICDGPLINAKQTECGHMFCAYCIELYHQIHKTCPECSCQISNALISLTQIDEDIQKLLKSCSSVMSEYYWETKTQREDKCNDRQKLVRGLRTKLYVKPKSSRETNNVNEVCEKLLSSIPILNRKSTSTTLPSLYRPPSSSARPSTTSFSPRAKSRRRSVANSDILSTINSPDMNLDTGKIDDLFHMYENVLAFEDGSEVGEPHEFRKASQNSYSFEENPISDFLKISEDDSSEIKFLKIRQKAEIDSLLKETEEIEKLDDFVNKWSDQLRNHISYDDGKLPEDRIIQLESLRDKAKERNIEEPPARMENPQSAYFDLESQIDQDIEEYYKELTDLGIDDPNNVIIADYDFDKIFGSSNPPPRSARQIHSARARLSTPSLKNRTKEETVASRFEEQTMAFCDKIQRCKSALQSLKEDAMKSPQQIRKLLDVQECNTARVRTITERGARPMSHSQRAATATAKFANITSTPRILKSARGAIQAQVCQSARHGSGMRSARVTLPDQTTVPLKKTNNSNSSSAENSKIKSSDIRPPN